MLYIILYKIDLKNEIRYPQKAENKKLLDLSEQIEKLQTKYREKDIEIQTLSQRLNMQFQSEIQRKMLDYEGILQQKNNQIEKFKIQVGQLLNTLIKLKEKQKKF